MRKLSSVSDLSEQIAHVVLHVLLHEVVDSFGVRLFHRRNELLLAHHHEIRHFPHLTV